MLRLYSLKDKNIWAGIVADEKGIQFTSFSTNNEKDLTAQASKALRGQKFQIHKPDGIIKRKLQMLADMYYGEAVRHSFNLHMDDFPKFTKKVLLATKKIPRGYVTTYGILSRVVGSPRAARAVGNVMAENPFVLIVPCHRVIPSDMTVGKYGLGSLEKKGILEREGVKFTGRNNERIGEDSLFKF